MGQSIRRQNTEASQADLQESATPKRDFRNRPGPKNAPCPLRGVANKSDLPYKQSNPAELITAILHLARPYFEYSLQGSAYWIATG